MSPAHMPLRKVVRVQLTSSIIGTQRNTLHLECGHVENIPRRQKPPKKRRCIACVCEADEARAMAAPPPPSRTYVLSGMVTISCLIEVDASSEDEARQLAADAPMMSLCNSCSNPEPGVWCTSGELDGVPTIETVMDKAGTP